MGDFTSLSSISLCKALGRLQYETSFHSSVYFMSKGTISIFGFLLRPRGAKQDVFVTTKTHLELPNLTM